MKRNCSSLVIIAQGNDMQEIGGEDGGRNWARWPRKTLFTDVFAYHDGKWQAVNAQELPAAEAVH